ncbi:MAG TPA: Fe-S cluster assembly protein SufD [Deltaproteobacteria bacterium]|nr:Fe-S cluster assembly protein SufD [Deltaproteobacteria bacterium]
MATDFVRQFERDLPLAGPAFWQKLRREGLEHFSRQGFPTRRLEEWKYFSVQDIAETDFHLGRDKALAGFTLEEMHRLAFCILPGIRLVFLNGHFHPTLSDLSKLPPGVKVKSLAQALQEDSAILEEHLAQQVSAQQHPFVALNTAFLQDGVFLQLERGTVLEKPVQLLFVSHGNGTAAISHPRVLVLAGPESQASLIETYVGEACYFTNAVTEIVAAVGAVIEHTKLQGESDAGFHLASTGVRQARDSRYTSHSISLGARLCRNDLSTLLDAPGAAATLNGLYVVSGKQVVDNHTNIDHAQPHCDSAELYKGILDGAAQGVFNGRILVRPDAQQTASSQTNKNLILSEDALINTKPLLEIYANDVKCSHGATIGRLDENQVFYLRSRGIDARLARSLLTYAFASDVLALLKQEALRERLQSLMFARLMGKSYES